MTQLLTRAKRALKREQEAYPCADCGRRSLPGETHTFLFCELYKQGWSRKQIIENAVFTVDTLRERGEVSS